MTCRKVKTYKHTHTHIHRQRIMQSRDYLTQNTYYIREGGGERERERR